MVFHKKTFYTRYTKDAVNTLFHYFKDHGYYVGYSRLSNRPERKYQPTTKLKPSLSMAEMFTALPLNSKELLKAYTGFLKGNRLSPSTVRSYGYFVMRFLDFYKPKPIATIHKKDMDRFFEVVLAGENFSISSHRQCLSTLKYFISFCKLPEFDIEDLKRPKRSRKLPVVLS